MTEAKQYKKPVIPVKSRKNGLKHITPANMHIGDTIKGTYLFTKKNVGKYEGEAYIIDPKNPDGLYIQLFSCTDLKYQMQYVKPLELIQITLVDVLKPDEEHKYSRFVFEVIYI